MRWSLIFILETIGGKILVHNYSLLYPAVLFDWQVNCVGRNTTHMEKNLPECKMAMDLAHSLSTLQVLSCPFQRSFCLQLFAANNKRTI